MSTMESNAFTYRKSLVALQTAGIPVSESAPTSAY